MRNLLNCSFLIAGLLFWQAACTPPTPPASPTPWPTATALAGTVEPTLTRRPTLTPTPTLEPEPPPTPSTTTIVLWESLPEVQTQRLSEEIDAFEAEFSAYTVVRKHYDSPESFMNALLTGQADFDVLLASPVLLTGLWREEETAPMSDFFPPSFIDGFASVTLQGATQEQELWGLPDTAGFHLLLFYNRELVDSPPTNTEELFELGQLLTQDSSVDAPSRWGLGLNSYDPLWVVPWLVPYGSWLTDSAGQPTLDTPAMEAALTLHQLWHSGSDTASAIAPVATYEQMRTQFLQGDTAMMIDGAWAIAELNEVEKLEWGVAPLPDVIQAQESQPAAPLVLARYWVISPSATGNRALAAATFLEYITRPERQLAWTARFGLLPTRRQALDDSTIVTNPALRASAEQLRTGRMVPPAANTNTILDAMRRPLQGLIDGELSPAEAAKIMQQAVGQ